MTDTPLSKLKDIALRGKGESSGKPMALSPAAEGTLDLDASMIREEDAHEEVEIAPDAREAIIDAEPKTTSEPAPEVAAEEDVGGQEEAAAIEETPAPAPADTSAAEPVVEDLPQGNIGDLIAGRLLPRSSLPIEQAGDYATMNDMLKDGKVRLGEVDGRPHIVLTPDAVADIIDTEKNEARETVEAIESAEREISEMQKRIEELQESKNGLLERASASRTRIGDLQALRDRLK